MTLRFPVRAPRERLRPGHALSSRAWSPDSAGEPACLVELACLSIGLVVVRRSDGVHLEIGNPVGTQAKGRVDEDLDVFEPGRLAFGGESEAGAREQSRDC